jgi:hypothetical protein
MMLLLDTRQTQARRRRWQVGRRQRRGWARGVDRGCAAGGRRAATAAHKSKYRLACRRRRGACVGRGDRGSGHHVVGGGREQVRNGRSCTQVAVLLMSAICIRRTGPKLTTTSGLSEPSRGLARGLLPPASGTLSSPTDPTCSHSCDVRELVDDSSSISTFMGDSPDSTGPSPLLPVVD